MVALTVTSINNLLLKSKALDLHTFGAAESAVPAAGMAYAAVRFMRFLAKSLKSIHGFRKYILTLLLIRIIKIDVINIYIICCDSGL